MAAQREHVERLSTFTPAFCATCRRRAGPDGYSPRKKWPLWSCQNPECKSILKRLHTMPVLDFDDAEKKALTASAKAMYLFMAENSTEDIFELSKPQALELASRIIETFGASLRKALVKP